MALPNITFIKGQGGLGRPLPGEDFISALLFYTGSLPSGFSSSDRVKLFSSIADAESAGISDDYSDATAATFTYLITTAGATGDVIKIAVTEPDQTSVLCEYTKVSGDSSIALLGASIAAAINAGTKDHGYTASFLTATLTVTCPKRLGIFVNSGTPVVVTITGTIAGTLTQPSGGAASKQAVWHYHIAEFFRIQPKGKLYVGFYAVPGSYTFAEISTMQTFANGKIRQIGVYKDGAAYSSSDITTIHNICIANDALKKPLSALYASDLSGTADITAVSDLSSLTAYKCSSVIGQDGGALGLFLFQTVGKSITSLGACLGSVALASVSESIAWVAKFNMSDGTELDIPAFANGQLVSAISDSGLDGINSKRHLFLKKFVGSDGTYWNDSHTSIVVSSDYAQIENNRVIDKAIRGIYQAMLPNLNSKLLLNSDGTLAETTTAFLIGTAEAPLSAMIRDADLSDFAVDIDTTQNVLSTSTIVISVSLIINGVARYINIPIGYKTSL